VSGKSRSNPERVELEHVTQKFNPFRVVKNAILLTPHFIRGYSSLTTSWFCNPDVNDIMARACYVVDEDINKKAPHASPTRDIVHATLFQ
jgi:hypothetical protein